MNLANYINDLLYRYNCVIIPNFGGFVTNKIGAKINEETHTFYPPKKQITFNAHLKENDGLLANYIATSENISFEKATQSIATTVTNWKKDLQNNSIQIGTVGVLTLNESGKIIFEPNVKVNYLAESFGLNSVVSNSILRQETKVKTLIPAVDKETKNGIPMFIKYAATAAILLTLGYVGNNAYQQNKQQNILANQEKAIEKKIQSATFVIANPLPTIELNVAKEVIVVKPYHIVAGAFQIAENADKKVSELKELGFDAQIIGLNKWGLTEVSFSSFVDRNEAINNLYKIQKTISKDAWLLTKK